MVVLETTSQEPCVRQPYPLPALSRAHSSYQTEMWVNLRFIREFREVYSRSPLIRERLGR